MNKQSLQAKIKDLSEQKSVPSNVILQNYFFDAFLKRLSHSQYSNNFVLKGGFLLASALGIEFRSTMDVDFLIRKQNLTKENVQKIFQKIASIKEDDDIIFEYTGMEEIRKEDIYGGFNILLVGHLENIRVPVSFDVATGDPITPDAVMHHYKCLFSEKELYLPSYNFETILSEKLETVLKRGTNNSRCKDFYDLFIIQKSKWDEINPSILKEAFIRTCFHRNNEITKNEALSILSDLETSSAMKTRWIAYQRKNNFAKEINFEDTLDSVASIINIVYDA